MRKILILLVLSCIAHTAFSQTSSIRGAIRDTSNKKNLQYAVVSLLSSTDSLLTRFTRTQADGSFAITNLEPGEYVMLISYPKFADYTDKVSLSAGQNLNLQTIPLTPTSILLKEVIVRSNNTMRIKGDTTEFTADSFYVKEGATVEELLKQIPGMQVNSKGEITAQGKRVDKVLVDGEEFFGDDPTIATQNIGAKAVDKVQVYDTKSEQDQLKGIGASGTGNKTINIKLKESSKKGYFGKAEGSSNFNKLHNAKLMYNKFQGNKKVSVYATKSNTSTGSLGWEERNKLGIEDDYEYDEISGYYYSYGDNDNDFRDWNLRGLPNAYTVGALFGNKWKEDKNKLNLSYLYNRLATSNTSKNLSQTLLEDTTFFNNSISKSKGLSQQHAVRGKYEWQIDSLTSIKYTVAGIYKKKSSFTDSYSEALNEASEFVNTNTRSNELNSEKRQLDNALTYKQLFKKKNRQLIATFRVGLVDDDQDGILSSTSHFYSAGNLDSVDVIDQQKINTGTSSTIGTKITFNEPLNDKWNIVSEYSLNSNQSSSHRNSFDKDGNGKYTQLNAVFSNNFNLDALSNSGTITARYLGKKLNFGFGTGLSSIRLNLKDLDLAKKTTYNFTGFTPQAQIRYKLKSQTNLSFSYRGNTVQPTITQLQPLRNNDDPLSIYVGNPDLKVGFNHSLNFHFNDYKVLSQRYAYMSFGISFFENAITNFSQTDSFGKTTYIPVNVNGNNNWYFYSAWNSEQGDKKFSHELSPQANGGRSRNYINGKENINTYANFTLNYGIRYTVKEKYNFTIGPTVTRSISKSSLRPSANNNYWTYGGRANGYIKLPWNLELESDVEMELRQKTAAFPTNVNTTVWNAELSRKFMKDKTLKIGLIAHDILNQNIGFNRTINSNFISEQRYDRLSRYFLLSVAWNFNKMPGQEKQ